MSNQFPTLHIVDHPLVAHKLPSCGTRTPASRISGHWSARSACCMTYEATRDLPMTTKEWRPPSAPRGPHC